MTAQSLARRQAVPFPQPERCRILRHTADLLRREELEPDRLRVITGLFAHDTVVGELATVLWEDARDAADHLHALRVGQLPPGEAGEGYRTFDAAEAALDHRLDATIWRLLEGVNARACRACRRACPVERWQVALPAGPWCARHEGEADAHATGGQWPC